MRGKKFKIVNKDLETKAENSNKRPWVAAAFPQESRKRTYANILRILDMANCKRRSHKKFGLLANFTDVKTSILVLLETLGGNNTLQCRHY